ncbi:MAG: hypothetical protein RL693_877 [Verrucomicrobiota bacterium]
MAAFNGDALSEIMVFPANEVTGKTSVSCTGYKIYEALSPRVEISGWFLSPQRQPVFGIRAKCGEKIWVAKRKFLKPEVLLVHRDRLDSLTSGFKVNCKLNLGCTIIELQFKDAERKWHSFRQCQLHLSFLWPFKKRQERPAAINTYELWAQKHGDADENELAAMRGFLSCFPRLPLISVLMPVYNAPIRWLTRAIESVRQQVYPHWELCIADDNSSDPEVRDVLADYAGRDHRIKVCYRETNGHICEASNSALALCEGEFTALLDHDDQLQPHALFHIAWEIANHPSTNIVFSDEDKMDVNDMRSDPYFKPGWNYDLLLGQNCVSHLGVFRTSLIREIGGFRRGLEGSQDWDLTLRAIAKAGSREIRHIPRVLYNWRLLGTSTASSMEAKPYAFMAGRNAVAHHLKETHSGAVLRDHENGARQILWPLPDKLPLVSVIIPVAGHTPLLTETLETLRCLKDYPDMEIIIVGNSLQEGQTRIDSKLQYVPVDSRCSLAAMSNLGVKHANGEVLLFMNHDVQITGTECLRELVRHVLRQDVGVVGPCIIYPDETIFHAGTVLRLAGGGGKVFHTSPLMANSIGGPPFLAREVSALSRNCLALRRELFERAGGFDEEHLPSDYFDVDLCLRLRSLGLRNIYTPFAQLVKKASSMSQSREVDTARKIAIPVEARVLMARWPLELAADAFFNPNLSLACELPLLSIPRVNWPWWDQTASPLKQS